LIERVVTPTQREKGLIFLAVFCSPDTTLAEVEGLRVFAPNPEKKWSQRWLLVEGLSLPITFCSATRCGSCNQPGWVHSLWGMHLNVGRNPCHLTVAMDSAAERWLDGDESYNVCEDSNHVAAFTGISCPHCGQEVKK
jgi:hypothetical protein